MKKVIFIGMTVIGLSAITSCKKDYVCSTIAGDVDYPGLKKDEAETAESACTLVGGTWSTK